MRDNWGIIGGDNWCQFIFPLASAAGHAAGAPDPGPDAPPWPRPTARFRTDVPSSPRDGPRSTPSRRAACAPISANGFAEPPRSSPAAPTPAPHHSAHRSLSAQPVRKSRSPSYPIKPASPKSMPVRPRGAARGNRGNIERRTGTNLVAIGGCELAPRCGQEPRQWPHRGAPPDARK
jgi:hypothetical protein